jgi:hypothetical protein
MALALALALLGCGGAGKVAQSAQPEQTAQPAQPAQPAVGAEVAAGGGGAVTAIDPRCAGLDGEARAVWSAKIRGELDFSVRIFEGEILAAEAELAVDRLDEFTSAWVEASEGACRKHAEAGTLDGEEHRALAACLDRALETQRAIIAAMKTGGKTAIAQAQTLPEVIRRCSGENVGAGATTDMRDNPFGGEP